MHGRFLFLFAMTTGLLGLAATAATAGSVVLFLVAGVPALVCVVVLAWVVYLDGRRAQDVTRAARELRRKL